MRRLPMCIGSRSTQSGRNVCTTTFDVIHGGIRCLNLLHDHPKRDELLDVLIDAGESAWARGAHEVGHFFKVTKMIF